MVKKFFLFNKLRVSFVRPQNSRTFWFLLKPVWVRSKVTAWQQNLFTKIYFPGKILGRCLLTVKKYFQLHQLWFLLLDLKTLRFFRCYYTHFGRDQRSQFNNDAFPKKFSAFEDLGMCLPYVKIYFQWYQWKIFFFRPQIS